MTGQAKDEGVSVERSPTSKTFKRSPSAGSRQSICKARVKRVQLVIDNGGRKAFT